MLRPSHALPVAIALAAVALVSPPFVRPVGACSVAPTDAMGLLGVESGASPRATTAPRNAIVVRHTDFSVDGEGRRRLEPDPRFPFSHPEPLFDLGQLASPLGRTVLIVDVVDLTAPSAPTLRFVEHRDPSAGCDRNVLCDIESIRITFDGSTDDFTLEGHLAYLLFSGEDAEAARAGERVDGIFSPDGIGELFVYTVDASELRGRWIALAAVDQAGNVSESSGAIRFRR